MTRKLKPARSADFLKTQALIFRCIGVNIKSYDDFVPSKLHLALTTTCMVCGALSLAVFTLKNAYPVESVVESLGGLLSSALCIIKCVLFLMEHNRILALIQRVKRLSIQAPGHTNAHRLFIWNIQRSDRILTRTYTVFCILTGFASVLLPFLKMGSEYKIKGSFTYTTPFPGSFPYDLQCLPFYAFTTVWCSIGVFTCVFWALAVDTLFCSLTHTVSANLRITQWHIRSLRSRHFVNDNTTSSSLVPVVYFQCQTYDTAAFLRRTFERILFVEFAISSLQLCIVAYQAAIKITQSDVIFPLVFILPLLTQVFIYCYCGEMLKNESLANIAAITESNWYELQPKYRRYMVLLLVRAQRACKVTGYLYEANLPAFTAILRVSLSNIMLLRSMAKKGEAVD